MAEKNVPPGDSFTVTDAETIVYKGRTYRGVTTITFPDGSTKTPAQLLEEAGSLAIDPATVRRCVKVEGYDPTANNRVVFTVYSSNSAQVTKNETSQVPGGMFCSMLDFLGDEKTNPTLKLWYDFFRGDASWIYYWSPEWLGFDLTYGVSEARSYVMTQVNDFLEESIPCPPSNIGVTHMHYAKLLGRYRPPKPARSGDLYVPLRHFRLYRANVTSAGTFAYQRVPVEPVGYQYLNPVTNFITTYNPPLTGLPRVINAGAYRESDLIYYYHLIDNAEADKLGETLPSLDWDAPPDDLQGLVAWRNGMMVAYRGNEVYLSEPYRPHAWPQKYIIPLQANVVALVVDENSLIAITDKQVALFGGTHPSNVVYEYLQNTQPGLHADRFGGLATPSQSFCRTPQGIFYASAEGLVHVAGGRARRVYEQLWTREEWEGVYGGMFGRMKLAYVDGKLLCVGGRSNDPGFILSLDEGGQLLTRFSADTTSATAPLGVYALPSIEARFGETGALMLLMGQVVAFGEPGAPTIGRAFATDSFDHRGFVYRSRIETLPRPVNMGVVQVHAMFDGDEATADDLVVEVVAWPDGTSGNPRAYPVLISGERLFDTVTFRLPGGYKARRWQVRLTAKPKVRVRKITLAETALELRNV